MRRVSAYPQLDLLFRVTWIASPVLSALDASDQILTFFVDSPGGNVLEAAKLAASIKEMKELRAGAERDVDAPLLLSALDAHML
jgi:hypothetical protein